MDSRDGTDPIDSLFADAAGRRRLRAEILPRLEGSAAARLAERLLAFPDDFNSRHRDRTTPTVVQVLSEAALLQHAPLLAGSNAAASLWERLAAGGPAAVVEAAEAIFRCGSIEARETTLYLLLIDREPPITLPPDARSRLLALALDDADDEVRGLAAELVAADDPERLLSDLARWTRDPSERARAATWSVAFTDDPEGAISRAESLVGDEQAPLSARRSALIALGDALPTDEIAPLLETMVTHPQAELAETAAELLWSQHRAPAIALAAAQSPHPAVRAIAERLLDPMHGSPAAGGFRPGAGDQGYDFYEQFKPPKKDNL